MIPKLEMDSASLYKLAKANDLGNIFYGVFSSDNIELPKTFPSACIVNTDDSKSIGQHWICLVFPTRNSVEYFDSYGLSYFCFPHFYTLIRNRFDAENIKFSEHSLQSRNSSSCGCHCIFFLNKRIVDNYSFEHIVNNIYRKDKCFNDCMVVGFCNDLKKKNNKLDIVIPNNLNNQECKCRKYFIY